MISNYLLCFVEKCLFVNPISSAKEIFCFIHIEKKILHDTMRISICLYYNLTELIVMETDHSVLK